MVYCNNTAELITIDEQLLWDGGLSFHSLITYIAAGFTGIGVLLSFVTIYQHATGYSKPYEQRHILRIIFMVPVYSVVSFLSIVYYRHAIYFQLLSDTYSAIAVSSGYALFIHYVAPNLHEQKNYFRNIRPKNWVWPISWFQRCCGGQRGLWRTPRSGLTWLNIISAGVYQYCAVRFANSIIAVTTQSFNLYCELSNNPVYAHIWVLVLDAISSSIALYCLGQFHTQLHADLARHGTKFKLFCLNAVLSLSQYQNLIISLITSSWLPSNIRNKVAPTPNLNAPDIKIGIPCLLLCFELSIIAVLHMVAFSPTGYFFNDANSVSPTTDLSRLAMNEGGFLGLKAILDAMNFWDIMKGFARSIRWLVTGRRHREDDPSYKVPTNEFDLCDTAPRNYGGLPIAQEFRRSEFGSQRHQEDSEGEGEALVTQSLYQPPEERWERDRSPVSHEFRGYNNSNEIRFDREALRGLTWPQRIYNNFTHLES